MSSSPPPDTTGWENAAPSFTVNGKWIDLEAVKRLWEEKERLRDENAVLRDEKRRLMRSLAEFTGGA